jgi:hypothetical protein
MNKLPIARNENIVVQISGKEVLIYDLNTNRAYNLNETSSIIYQACDGKTTFTELTAKYGFTDDVIFLAIDELSKEHLIEKSDEYNSPFKGLSRRAVLRKAGIASMVALPVIVSLTAPTAAMAQSSCVNPGGRAPGTAAATNEHIVGSGTCADFNSRCCDNTATGSCTPEAGFPGHFFCTCTC